MDLRPIFCCFQCYYKFDEYKVKCNSVKYPNFHPQIIDICNEKITHTFFFKLHVTYQEECLTFHVQSNTFLSASIIKQNFAWYIEFKLPELEGQLFLLVSFKHPSSSVYLASACMYGTAWVFSVQSFSFLIPESTQLIVYLFSFSKVTA